MLMKQYPYSNGVEEQSNPNNGSVRPIWVDGHVQSPLSYDKIGSADSGCELEFVQYGNYWMKCAAIVLEGATPKLE